MLVLLPPSEGKHQPERGAPLDLARMSLPQLTARREVVLDALADVSARPDAPFELGVSPRLVAELERNTRLRTLPTAPAGRVYTGVLYAALDLATLDAAAHRRALRRMLVVSALFGALRLSDRVPAYRLSMGVDLPPVGPLAALWRAPLAEALPTQAGRGVIVDLRSSTYATAWTPSGRLAERWVAVRVPGVSHQAKHTRGLVARALAQAAADPHHPAQLAQLLEPTFEVRLNSPQRPGRPWVLETTARPGVAPR